VVRTPPLGVDCAPQAGKDLWRFLNLDQHDQPIALDGRVPFQIQPKPVGQLLETDLARS
jgi:hypothetical protein